MFIMFIGVLAISPDAMFVRFMQAEADDGSGTTAANDLQITFWKYLLIFPLHLAVTTWHAGGGNNLLRTLKAGPGHIVTGGACQACISISLNLAYTNTVAARAHVFFALSPFWAALLSRGVLKDAVPVRTTVALLLAGASILIVFLPKLAPSLDEQPAAAPGHSSAAVAAGATSVGHDVTVTEVATLYGDLLGILGDIAPQHQALAFLAPLKRTALHGVCGTAQSAPSPDVHAHDSRRLPGSADRGVRLCQAAVP